MVLKKCIQQKYNKIRIEKAAKQKIKIIINNKKTQQTDYQTNENS